MELLSKIIYKPPCSPSADLCCSMLSLLSGCNLVASIVLFICIIYKFRSGQKGRGHRVCRWLCMGYWLSVRSRWLDIDQVLFCVFMDRDEVEAHKLAKKERGQYPAVLTEQTWSIKDLLYGFWWNFACGIQRVVPSGQDGSILPARVANHSARFASSHPLPKLAI